MNYDKAGLSLEVEGAVSGEGVGVRMDIDDPKVRHELLAANALLEKITARSKAQLDQVSEGSRRVSDGRMQFMVLAAGIAGGVAPLLFNQPGLASPRYLRVAAICFFTSIVIGVVLRVAQRTLTASVIWAITTATKEEMALSTAQESVRISKQFSQSVPERIPDNATFLDAQAKTTKALKRRLTLAAIEDFLFFGVFLIGLAFLIAAIAWGG